MRRWNTDPIEYAWQSTYVCFNNDPIYYADPSGLEGINPDDGGKKKKHNRRNTTATWETKNPDGTLTGEAAPPVDLEAVQVTAVRIGNADPQYVEWIEGIGVEGIDDFTTQLYIQKISHYNDGLGRGLYGTNGGYVNVPQEIRDR